MKKKEAKQVLKGFGWVYLFFAAVAIIFAIIFGSISSYPEAVTSLMPKNTDPKVYLVSSFVAAALVELWYFWLLRRFVSGKSNGTFYMVLLILGVIGNLISLFTTAGTSTLNLVLDAVALYFVIQARKQGK